MTTRNLDVSGLPDHAFGSRSLLWWGTMGFIVIEVAIFGVLIATYLYGMARADVWPPEGKLPQWLYGGLITVLLLLSLWPNWRYKKAAELGEVGTVRRCLAAATILKTALLAVRGFEFAALEVLWHEHFYGSILWTLLLFHTLHLFSDWVESAVLLVIAFRKDLAPRRCADIAENALYWYFAVAAWLPLFVIIYLVPRLTQ